MALGERLKASF